MFLLLLLISTAAVRKQHRQHAKQQQTLVPTQLYLLKGAALGPLAKVTILYQEQEHLVFRFNVFLATR